VEAGSPSGNATNHRLRAKIRFCKKRICSRANAKLSSRSFSFRISESTHRLMIRPRLGRSASGSRGCRESGAPATPAITRHWAGDGVSAGGLTRYSANTPSSLSHDCEGNSPIRSALPSGMPNVTGSRSVARRTVSGLP